VESAHKLNRKTVKQEKEGDKPGWVAQPDSNADKTQEFLTNLPMKY
jgi:hypothetical protein